MSSGKIILTVIRGNPEGQEYVFDNHSWCLIGRGNDCDLRLPKDFEHADISRHHCLLEIDLPSVRVRDLGSRNGTFVNGLKIGQRSMAAIAPEFDLSDFAAHELRDRDELQVGHTVFRIELVDAQAMADTMGSLMSIG
jgi:eukaryotic-like serine/threonine-protein kinase